MHRVGVIGAGRRGVARGGVPVSSGRDGLRVVKVLIGFLESQARDNAKVRLPLPR